MTEQIDTQELEAASNPELRLVSLLTGGRYRSTWQRHAVTCEVRRHEHDIVATIATDHDHRERPPAWSWPDAPRPTIWARLAEHAGAAVARARGEAPGGSRWRPLPVQSAVGTADDLTRAKEQSKGLGIFTRSRVGLDREAAKTHREKAGGDPGEGGGMRSREALGRRGPALADADVSQVAPDSIRG